MGCRTTNCFKVKVAEVFPLKNYSLVPIFDVQLNNDHLSTVQYFSPCCFQKILCLQTKISELSEQFFYRLASGHSKVE